jgi:hypothetical protein
MKPLFCIPSPRHIPVVKAAFDLIPYDKLYFKDNFDELQVYQVFREYFLENKDYTHFVILPDDLLVDPETIEKLMKDLEKRDYPVLSGVCNFNCDAWETFDIDLAIDYHKTAAREYLLANEIPNFEYYCKINSLSGIKKVAFAGFPITFIKREVIEKVPFGSTGRGIDSFFSVELLKKRIDQYVDFDARSIHLKGIENCIDIATLLGFQFEDNISTIVNFKRRVTPKLYLETADGTKTEIDISKYINNITLNE